MSSSGADILLVEDSDDDVALTREAFKRAQIAARLHHVTSGTECLEFLRKQGKFAASPTPDFVLLDLNLPAMSGREVLAERATDLNLRRVPVIVLSTSANPRDVIDSYTLGCNSYLVKPVDFDEFERTVRCLAQYWLGVVTLPR